MRPDWPASRNPIDMLHTLNALAAKLSPTQVQNVDGNANRIATAAAAAATALTTLNGNSDIEMAIPTPCASTADGSNDTEQPETDYIKMFVGQIPRAMNEQDLMDMFGEFGRVYQLNLLRDKFSGVSKGCCFVTYYTRKAALDAQNALHNIKTLPGMHHPIQMKPADSENRSERKLFIGMLSKKISEPDIRLMFEPFGAIEECSVLRDPNGVSKGCAFVTYTTKQNAIAAIKGMHHSQTMEGCTCPLVVKFADTQKEKDQKRMQQMQANLWGLAATGGNSVPTAQYLALGVLANQQMNSDTNSLSSQVLQQIQLNAAAAAVAANNNNNHQLNNLLLTNNTGALKSPYHVQTSHYHPTHVDTVSPRRLDYTDPFYTGYQNLSASPPSLGDLNPGNLQNLSTLANLSVGNPIVNSVNMQNLVTLAAMGANSVSPTGSSSSSLSSSALSSLSPTSAAAAVLFGKNSGLLAGTNGTNGGTYGSSLNALGLTLADLNSNQFAMPQSPPASSPLYFLNNNNNNNNSPTKVSSKQLEGPEGANLFIYHLPQDFADSDLVTMFLPFGNVISAKVYIDKETKLSKCFGFVSYDNAYSAQAAIQTMNSYQVGNKRLKVQLKRPKEASRPY
ncbi:CUGBP Elav-like family member 1 isoform X1 [Melanaphis sacchari]|uniref:CUGBP Elav-like family member 1 isoform X1 n=2 Tax=Melanaphis sacchari TaxID=742174 RepID=UPI000DC135C5|nr:CUGBP Elav-like family member 1 isoform X1 [Melanaphis sacchari]XP_025199584.1 CUGBP Elav-like family member 1 isoform X1 [Melanaphis sacchari]